MSWAGFAQPDVSPWTIRSQTLRNNDLPKWEMPSCIFYFFCNFGEIFLQKLQQATKTNRIIAGKGRKNVRRNERNKQVSKYLSCCRVAWKRNLLIWKVRGPKELQGLQAIWTFFGRPIQIVTGPWKLFSLRVGSTSNNSKSGVNLAAGPKYKRVVYNRSNTHTHEQQSKRSPGSKRGGRVN